MSDHRTTTGEALPVSRRQRRLARWKLLKFVLAGSILFIAIGFLIRVDRSVFATGYVTTDEYAEVRAAVQGSVATILVDSGEEARAGDVLLQLEDSRERALRDEAVGRLRKTEAQLSRREAEIAEEDRQREARIAIARLRLEHATVKLELARELSEKGLVSGRAVEDERLNEELAQAEVEALRSRDDTLGEKELAVLRRELDASRSTVKKAEADLRARQVRAPISGKVLRYEFVVGELVGPATVLYEMFGGTGHVLKLRVPEKYATLVAVGQPYRARLRPYKRLGRVLFTGKVEKLRDVIETEGQKTYRVTYCSFNAEGYPVPPGTTAEAWIRVGRSPFWLHLFGLH